MGREIRVDALGARVRERVAAQAASGAAPRPPGMSPARPSGPRPGGRSRDPTLSLKLLSSAPPPGPSPPTAVQVPSAPNGPPPPPTDEDLSAPEPPPPARPRCTRPPPPARGHLMKPSPRREGQRATSTMARPRPYADPESWKPESPRGLGTCCLGSPNRTPGSEGGGLGLDP
ncbi:proline-rich receptor-like protein kinase PERK9 [Onychomys torridus]|uniref:proline-rich receptor-like protein kinase PERK9 n=1 Tax=Onychomys torridus TaxID=38674 RepID=UPI00167FBFBF|nr:proline-rich receptor-like protein kinase PERK9 [Onychomys torridus]